MWTLLQNIGFAVIGILAGLGIGLLTLKLMRKTKRGGAIALAGALFMAMGHFTPRGPSTTQEPSDHTKTRKGANSGDPPEPDGA